MEDELAPAAFVEAEESEPIVEAATEGELIEPSLEEDADEALVEPEPLQPAAEAVPEPARRGWRFWRSPRAVEPPAEPDAVHRSHVRVLVPEPTAEEEALEQFVEPVEEPELARAEEPIPDPEPVVPAELIEVELPTPPEPEPVSERLDGWPSAADFEPRAADEETEVPAGSEDTLLHAEGPGSPEENGSAVEAPLEPAAESATEEPEAVFGWQQEPEVVPEPVEHRPGRRWFRRRRSEELAVPAPPSEDFGIEDEPELLAASADEAALVAEEHGIVEPRTAEPDVVEPVEETPRETELDREEVVLAGQRREPPTPPAASLRRGRR
ncbi:MAG: hypothetical protein H0T39_03500 [Actinobacteria bacterium]|nr:hypothetical protein [Actinomycetota bacterium]